jgi:hypothetical protein
MVSVILTDAAHKDIAAIDDSTLDLAFGSDENDFEFSFIDTCDAGLRFHAGSFCYIDGTEYGGVVDSITTEKTHDGTALTYTGRSWHGVLAEQVLQPDTGADYLTVNGTVQAALQSCFDRIHLSNLFIADANTESIRYQFDRYTNAWNGIRKMLRASSLKLVLNYHDGKVHAFTAPIEAYSDVVDSDLMDFTATRDWRPVNHLIGLGAGELRNRVVSHWYADEDGKVSQTQSLVGIDEVCETYDYSNAAADELADETKKKLQELQSQGSVDVTINSSIILDLDDIITASDHVTGLSVTAQITKKIVKISDGIMSVDYEVGKSSSTSGGLSGSAESSPGSVSYTAGAGITISSHVISAEVTQAKLDVVSTVANAANKTASDMSSELGAILQSDSEQTTAIVKAQSTADSGVSAAAKAKATADSGVQNAAVAQATANAANQAATSAQTAANIAIANARELVLNPNMDAEVGNIDNFERNVILGDTSASVPPPEMFSTYARKTGRGSSINREVLDLPGHTLQISGWFFADTNAKNDMKVGINYYFGTSSSNVQTWKLAFQIPLASGQSGWAKYTGTVTLPDDLLKSPRYARLWMAIDTYDGDETGWYFTGLSLKEITEAKAAQDAAKTAQTAADEAQDTADSAISTASSAVQSISAASPLTATRSGNIITLSAPTATSTTAGSMSAVDKSKLDGIAAGANKYILPAATTTALGGVKPDGHTITVTSDGVLTAHSDSEAASFLAAYPIGSTYKTISPTNPGTTYGGTWVEVDSLDYFTYERTA